MSAFSIWEQGGKCSGEELGILIVVHKNRTTTFSNPGDYWRKVFLLGIRIGCVLRWFVDHLQQCCHHLKLGVLALSFDIAVDDPTSYRSISHIVQSTVEVIFG